MITYHLTSTLIGISIAVAIFWLVRRDHLHGPYAIWWIGAAITVGILGFFPRSFDYLAVHLGINYPPVLAIVIALGLLLVKMLTMDLERSRQERLIRRLAQRLAMLEARSPLPTPQSAGTINPDPQKTSSTDQATSLESHIRSEPYMDLSTSSTKISKQNERFS